MKKLFIIHYTCEVEQFGPEGEEYTVERDFTRRFTNYHEAEQCYHDLDMIGASKVETEEIPYVKCLFYYALAAVVAIAGGYKLRKGQDLFYDLLLRTRYDVGNDRLAEWFDHHSYNYDHRDEGRTYYLLWHDDEVAVSKTFKGILTAWWSELAWNHHLTKIDYVAGDFFNSIMAQVVANERWYY